MSGQIRGNQHNTLREPHDDYPTDPHWTWALLRRVKLRGEVWEPAAGAGMMAAVLRQFGYQVRTSDIRSGTDFLTCTDRADNIVTNPPYRLLDDFIEHALAQADRTVCMLASLQALGGERRAERIWRPRPPSLVLVVPGRMKVNGSSSQFCHAWLVWGRSPGIARIEWAS